MELTINDIKELINTETESKSKHPLNGQRVVAVLPHGFVHFGTLHDNGGHYTLTNASNLRYWKMRGGGLPEFANKGPVSEDKIDNIGTLYFDSVLFFYPTGEWDE